MENYTPLYTAHPDVPWPHIFLDPVCALCFSFHLPLFQILSPTWPIQWQQQKLNANARLAAVKEDSTLQQSAVWRAFSWKSYLFKIHLLLCARHCASAWDTKVNTDTDPPLPTKLTWDTDKQTSTVNAMCLGRGKYRCHYLLHAMVPLTSQHMGVRVRASVLARDEYRCGDCLHSTKTLLNHFLSSAHEYHSSQTMASYLWFTLVWFNRFTGSVPDLVPTPLSLMLAFFLGHLGNPAECSRIMPESRRSIVSRKSKR